MGHLRMQAVPADDVIFSFAELCSCMYFVRTGSLVYLRYSCFCSNRYRPRPSSSNEDADGYKSSQNVVRAGDCLSEPVLWCRWQHCGDLAGQAPATLLELHIEDLNEVATNYPDVVDWGSKHAKFVVDVLNGTTVLSDLLNTSSIYEDKHQRGLI